MHLIMKCIKSVLEKDNIKYTIDNESYTIAKNANIIPFLYASMDPNTDLSLKKKIKQIAISYMIIDEKQNTEYQNICCKLNEKSIKYSFLKGLNLKKYYPEAYFRYMCDFDLLVEKNKLKIVGNILEDMGYKKAESTDHDITYSKAQFNVELHFLMIPKKEHGAKYFKNPFDNLLIFNNNGYIFKRKEDEFIFYFFHLLKHYEERGIGIRNFIDLYLFYKNNELDWNVIKQAYQYTCFEDDCEIIERFIKNFFEDTEENQILINEIFNDQTFGTKEKELRNELDKTTYNKWLLKKIFPGLQKMKNMYGFLRYKFFYIIIPLLYFHYWIKFGLLKFGYSYKKIKKAKKLKNAN